MTRILAKFAPLHLAIFDHQLRSEVHDGIVPHLPDTFGLGCFMGAEPAQCLDHISTYIYVVGISEMPGDTGFAVIETCQTKRQPCGVIMRTHSPAKWRRLADLQKYQPFAFVIAVGGPRTELAQMFRGTPTFSDITDLIVPGPRIARFIADKVDREKSRYLNVAKQAATA